MVLLANKTSGAGELVGGLNIAPLLEVIPRIYILVALRDPKTMVKSIGIVYNGNS